MDVLVDGNGYISIITDLFADRWKYRQVVGIKNRTLGDWGTGRLIYKGQSRKYTVKGTTTWARVGMWHEMSARVKKMYFMQMYTLTLPLNPPSPLPNHFLNLFYSSC